MTFNHDNFNFAGPVVKAGMKLIPINQIAYVSLEHLEDQLVVIRTVDEMIHYAFGFDAIELVFQLKPSALEGRRLKWRKGAWAWHNLGGHIGCQLLVWLGFKKAAIRWHDFTTPRLRDC